MEQTKSKMPPNYLGSFSKADPKKFNIKNLENETKDFVTTMNALNLLDGSHSSKKVKENTL